MLVLMCEAGGSRYAVDSSRVVEVLPCVRSEQVPDGPDWLAGMFAYRGRATPLVDLTWLTAGRPCARRWNSRIILARFDAEDTPELIGLLAERVTTAEIDEETDRPTEDLSGVSSLGPILLDEQGMFQLIDPTRLLSADRRDAMQSALTEEQP
ncbi:MAG: chemotaxis protein CheW [Planctomycetota bacterium]|jgi:chemotaxis-related protein WspB